MNSEIGNPRANATVAMRAMGIVAAVLGVLLLVSSVAAVICPPVGSITLRPDQFRKGKGAEIFFYRSPPALVKWQERGVPIRLWLGGDKLRELASVEEVGNTPGVGFRMKAGTMLYVNRALLDLIEGGARLWCLRPICLARCWI